MHPRPKGGRAAGQGLCKNNAGLVKRRRASIIGPGVIQTSHRVPASRRNDGTNEKVQSRARLLMGAFQTASRRSVRREQRALINTKEHDALVLCKSVECQREPGGGSQGSVVISIISFLGRFGRMACLMRTGRACLCAAPGECRNLRRVLNNQARRESIIRWQPQGV
ncbi:hypothetical protein ROLI_031490 [Roseobacter fucihabitans]|uniref:Uncharacterized protein n=1 Tax=Roseobacter fucihabitans TaxID=1537242 RepID=A0ABZ2BWF7_9RHOB|nr:hypothetical protein [Roseobacter litoralis]